MPQVGSDPAAKLGEKALILVWIHPEKILRYNCAEDRVAQEFKPLVTYGGAAALHGCAAVKKSLVIDGDILGGVPCGKFDPVLKILIAFENVLVQ